MIINALIANISAARTIKTIIESLVAIVTKCLRAQVIKPITFSTFKLAITILTITDCCITVSAIVGRTVNKIFLLA